MKLAKIKNKEILLADLKQDPKNARKHNPRNIGMIEKSIRQVGAARSGVVDEDGVILAGNGTFDALTAAGIEKVIEIETSGNEWVVVKRTGLTTQQKRELALADNRSAELAEWDGPMLEAQGIDLAPWFTSLELKALGIIASTPNSNIPEDKYREQYGVIVVCEGQSDQERAYNALLALGYNCKVVNT